MSTKEIDSKDFSNNTELLQRETIIDSPFSMIGAEGKWFGVMGQYRVTEDYENKKELKEELQKITWNRIVQVMLILQETKPEIDKEFNNKKES